MTRILAAILFCLLPAAAWAQSGQSSDCSGQATASASLVVFPKASAGGGPAQPTQFVTIFNPDAANTLWLNVTPTGTAAANAQGSFSLTPSGSVSWYRPAYPPPVRISIIAPAGATNYTCFYQ